MISSFFIQNDSALVQSYVATNEMPPIFYWQLDAHENILSNALDENNMFFLFCGEEETSKTTVAAGKAVLFSQMKGMR